ncbi:MAG: glycosyltransferase family 2 protein [Gemmataceae bacterium]
MNVRQPLLSIVCPAYEEQEVLPHFHEALCESLESIRNEYRLEIVYVDDGSRDRTLEVLRTIAESDRRVRFLSLSRNFGHQAALTAGLESARGEAVVTLDSDLQHPPELIPTLVAKWREGFDVVLTIRADDQRLSWFKRTSSQMFYRLLRRWSDLDVRVAASDYRLMSRRAVQALLSLRESHRYIRGMVQWLGFPTAEVPFVPNARKAGVSKYTLRKMVRLASDGLFSFSRVPLRLSVLAGFAITGLSSVATVASVFARSRVRPVDPLLVALLIAVHIVGATMLGAMAVLGEYVGRIAEECKRRPAYLLKEVFPRRDERSRLEPPDAAAA